MIWFSAHASFRQEKPHKGKCGPQKVIYLSQELRKDITILDEQISLFCKLFARTDTMKALLPIFVFNGKPKNFQECNSPVMDIYHYFEF